MQADGGGKNAMKRLFAALALASGVVLWTGPAISGDPVISDSRLLTDERRMAILEAKLASLQREANLLEDHRAIERLQQAYGHYVSLGMAAEAAALFSDSPAASIEFAQQGVYLGRTRIEAFLKASGARLLPGEFRENAVMQGVIHVAADGRTAKARWRSLVMGGMQGEDGRWTEGPYENEYVKEGGQWKIATLHWYTTVEASYDKGWHRQPYPVAGPLQELPPDRPPSMVYQSYPNYFLPPYHYFNPVTGKPVAWDEPLAGGTQGGTLTGGTR
jgi:SnoaL-like domain